LIANAVPTPKAVALVLFPALVALALGDRITDPVDAEAEAAAGAAV